MSDKKITWEQLLEYHLSKPDKSLLRTKEIQSKYDKYTDILKLNGMSINKYIISVLFSEDNCDKKFLITKNKFPYNLDKDITHLLIWINPLNKIGQDEVLAYITEHCGKDSFGFNRNVTLTRNSLQISARLFMSFRANLISKSFNLSNTSL